MLFRRRRGHGRIPSGFYRFETRGRTLHGFGEGEYVQVRDEFGNTWRGTAERQADDSIHFRFRGPDGKSISGISDSFGIALRDERGNVWRGFLD